MPVKILVDAQNGLPFCAQTIPPSLVNRFFGQFFLPWECFVQPFKANYEQDACKDFDGHAKVVSLSINGAGGVGFNRETFEFFGQFLHSCTSVGRG